MLSKTSRQLNGDCTLKIPMQISCPHRSRGSDVERPPRLRKVTGSKPLHRRAPTVKTGTNRQLVTWHSVLQGCVGLGEASQNPDNASSAARLLALNLTLGKQKQTLRGGCGRNSFGACGCEPAGFSFVFCQIKKRLCFSRILGVLLNLLTLSNDEAAHYIYKNP